jgi:hypothetical protein
VTVLAAHPVLATLLAATDQPPQLPEDVGKAGPTGLAVLLVLAVAVWLLCRSMSRHLKRVPRSFDDDDDDALRAGDLPRVPDTPAELFGETPPVERAPGQDLLDTLKRAPRAIEGPRPTDPPPEDGAPRR